MKLDSNNPMDALPQDPKLDSLLDRALAPCELPPGLVERIVANTATKLSRHDDGVLARIGQYRWPKALVAMVNVAAIAGIVAVGVMISHRRLDGGGQSGPSHAGEVLPARGRQRQSAVPGAGGRQDQAVPQQCRSQSRGHRFGGRSVVERPGSTRAARRSRGAASRRALTASISDRLGRSRIGWWALRSRNHMQRDKAMIRRRCSLWVGLAMALALGLGPPAASRLLAADNRPAPAPATQPAKPKGLSADDIKDAMEVLSAIEPELATRISEAMEKHPEQVQEMVAKVWPKIRPWVNSKRRDPDMFRLSIDDIRLTRRGDDLVKRIKSKVDSGSEDSLLAELRDVLRQRFEGRLKDARDRGAAHRGPGPQDAGEELTQKAKDEAKTIESQVQQMTGLKPAPVPPPKK